MIVFRCKNQSVREIRYFCLYELEIAVFLKKEFRSDSTFRCEKNIHHVKQICMVRNSLTLFHTRDNSQSYNVEYVNGNLHYLHIFTDINSKSCQMNSK